MKKSDRSIIEFYNSPVYHIEAEEETTECGKILILQERFGQSNYYHGGPLPKRVNYPSQNRRMCHFCKMKIMESVSEAEQGDRP